MDETITIAVKLLVAYFLADLLGGIGHCILDHGPESWSLARDFRAHHTDPSQMRLTYKDFLIGVPIFALWGLAGGDFLLMVAICLTFTQVFHYYTHHPAPLPILILQWCYIAVRPEVHGKHHKRPVGDYCILSGWANPLLNWILGSPRTSK